MDNAFRLLLSCSETEGLITLGVATGRIWKRYSCSRSKRQETYGWDKTEATVLLIRERICSVILRNGHFRFSRFRLLCLRSFNCKSTWITYQSSRQIQHIPFHRHNLYSVIYKCNLSTKYLYKNSIQLPFRHNSLISYPRTYRLFSFRRLSSLVVIEICCIDLWFSWRNAIHWPNKNLMLLIKSSMDWNCKKLNGVHNITWTNHPKM